MLLDLLYLVVQPAPEYKTKWASEKHAIIHEIKVQSELYGVDTKTALRIAKCESEFKAKAQNPNSTAGGVYQFIDSTFNAYCTGEKMSYQDNVRCFMELYPKNKSWWECQ